MASMGSPLDDRVPMAELLLKSGAQVDVRDAGGRTALHTAAIFLQKRLIVALEHAGAEPSLADSDGHTAGELASNVGLNWPTGERDADAPRDVILAAHLAPPVR
jgi:ankyrin repeat protein